MGEGHLQAIVASLIFAGNAAWFAFSWQAGSIAMIVFNVAAMAMMIEVAWSLKKDRPRPE